MKHYNSLSVFLFLLFIYNANAQQIRMQFKKVIVDYQNKTFKIESPVLNELENKILVTIIVKNNAYSLPTFLSSLEQLKCLNKKCDLWFGFNIFFK